MGTAGAVAMVVAIVVWHNAVHLAPSRWRDLVVSVGVALAALAGATWLYAAVDPASGLVAAVPWTVAAFVVTAMVVLVVRGNPRWGAWLADRRIRAMSDRTFLVHVLVRIPLLTALVEEILFRGVVWRLLDRVGGTTLALVGSAVAFGLGHLVVATEQARREQRSVVAWVATTVLATTVAGLALGGLRLATGGIWASVGVHAAVNMTLAWGARTVRPEVGDDPPG